MPEMCFPLTIVTTVCAFISMIGYEIIECNEENVCTMYILSSTYL